MSYGIITYKADGTPIIEPTNAGGVFVEDINRQPSQGSTTIYYNDLVGLTLRVFQVYAGCYTWSVGTSSGVPYISLNRNTVTPFDARIRLLVFAV